MEQSLAIATQSAKKVHNKGDDKPIDQSKVYYYVFALLLDSMTIRQDSIKVEATELKQTASDENAMSKELSKLKYEELPSGQVSQKTIARVENANAQLSKQRQFIQNVLITLRQGAQVGYTEANTNVDLVEQDAAENTGYLKTLNIVFKLTNSLTKRNQ